MAHNAEEAPVLIGLTKSLAGTRWSLDCDEFLIGRNADCDLIVPERQISRHHARIRRTSRGFSVEDLGSRNGTYINGIPVERSTVLRDGDVIQIALALELAFVGTDATLPLILSDERLSGHRRLRMDPQAHRVWARGTEVEPPLSPPQYRLLELLYENQERVLAREQIVECVWPGTMGIGVSEQAIDALVRRLRYRLAEADPDRAYILTVRGHGFRLDNPLWRPKEESAVG